MSKPIWSKTAIAQAVGLTVAGAGVATTDALAQDMTPTLRITNYNLDVKTDDISKYSGLDVSGTGDAEVSNAFKFDLTVPLDAKWDVRLSAKKYDADGDSAGYKYVSGSAAYTLSSGMTIDSNVIDLEVGHHLNLGGQDLRVFAGLRYVDLQNDVSSGYSVKYFSPPAQFGFTQTLSNDIKAYGLRGGAEGTMPINKTFSVSGLAAVSAVHGDRDRDVSFGYVTNLGSDSDTWYGTELEVAVNWDPSPQAEGGALVSLGYTWNKTWDIINTRFGPTVDESDLTESGMFVRLTFPL